MQLGAFSDRLKLRVLVDRQVQAASRGDNEDWALKVWIEATSGRYSLLPYLPGTGLEKAWVDGCGPIADLLLAEADKLLLLAAPAGAKLEPVGQTITASISPSPPRGDEDLYLSPAEIAKRYKLPRGALESRLKRWRMGHGDGWKQVTNPKPREPRYLYCVCAVWSVIQDLAKTIGETTGERPAK
jgi:hypothetical protein